MARVFEFQTDHFGVDNEPENPINPIGGYSLLKWLVGQDGARLVESAEPEPEDWGWYVELFSGQQRYLVGCSVDSESERDGRYRCVIQVEKQRGLLDVLFRRNKLTGDDAVCRAIRDLLRSSPRTSNFEDVGHDG